MTQTYTVVIPHVKYEVQECIEADTPEQAAEIALDNTWLRQSSFASTARHVTVVDLTTADVTAVPFAENVATIAKREDWTAKDMTFKTLEQRFDFLENVVSGIIIVGIIAIGSLIILK